MPFKFNISLIDAFVLMYYVIYNDNVTNVKQFVLCLFYSCYVMHILMYRSI